MLYNRCRRFFGLREIPDDSDYVIAADAGYEYCRKNNIIPDLVLGDFDSLGVAPKHPNVMQLPVEKDDTDTVFAIKTGLEKGYRHFYIYGGLGGSAATTRSQTCNRFSTLQTARQEDGCSVKTACGRR